MIVSTLLSILKNGGYLIASYTDAGFTGKHVFFTKDVAAYWTNRAENPTEVLWKLEPQVNNINEYVMFRNDYQTIPSRIKPNEAFLWLAKYGFADEIPEDEREAFYGYLYGKEIFSLIPQSYLLEHSG